jgi:hypothetical protein
MKLCLIVLFVAVVAVSLGSAALAQCPSHQAAKDGTVAQDGGAAPGCAATCHGDKAGEKCSGALAGMPKMTCKVGDKTTCCPLEADKLAKDSGEKIVYVVAGKEYNDRNEALDAYAKQLNDHLAAFTTVSYAVGERAMTSPVAASAVAQETRGTVKYVVASYAFASQDDAASAVKAARAAAETVTMKRFVDGKEVCTKTANAAGHTCCGKSGEGKVEPTVAKAAPAAGQTCSHNENVAAKDGTKTETVATKDGASKCEYVVGDMKTCCEHMAQVQLAVGKIQAAYNTVQELAAKGGAQEVAAGTSSAANVTP